MRTKLLLVAAVLMMAAMPGFIPVRATSDSGILPENEASPETFAAICRSDPVQDTRPVPAWLRQDFAGDTCRAPSMPAAIDGYTATLEQINAGMEAAQRYAVAADAFQKCVREFVASRKATGAAALSRSQAAIQDYRILISQRSKEKVARQTSAAIIAFNEYGSLCPMPM
jgi:hypothetical protein